jgi:hypothetical protein
MHKILDLKVGSWISNTSVILLDSFQISISTRGTRAKLAAQELQPQALIYKR